jgi:all-trans-retinol 13,14-reductase
MSKKFDVIIIGSGIGGLTIGSLLSGHKKVLVLEKNSSFGGYCTSFQRKDCKFESSVQAINGLYEKNPIYEILKTSNALKGLKIARPDHLYRTIFPDYDIRVPQADISKYKSILFSLFPEEKDGIADLFDTLKSIYQETTRFYQGGTFRKSPLVFKYGKQSLLQLLNAFIKDKKLQAIISQYWMYRGLPPARFSAITFAYIWYDYTANGSYFPEGGMGGIVRNLVDSIKANDGALYRSKEVIRIIAKDDKVTEIELDDHKKYEADIVVSNIDIFKTFDMIVGVGRHRINEYVSKLRENSLSISAFKIYLGLDVDVRELGIDDYEIFVNPSYDIESMYRASVNNELEKVPYSMTIYSNLSDDFCKKGNSVISIGLLSGYDFWRNLPGAEYKQKKKGMAKIILSRCEKIIPGLQRHIKVKAVATPLTMERYTGNSRGSIYGWNKKSLMEEIRFMNSTTPVKNLFLSSHWTKMGGGIGGAVLSSNRVSHMIDSRTR